MNFTILFVTLVIILILMIIRMYRVYLFRMFVHSKIDDIVMNIRNNKVVNVSKNVENILGYQKNDMINHNIFIFVHYEDYDELKDKSIIRLLTYDKYYKKFKVHKHKNYVIFSHINGNVKDKRIKNLEMVCNIIKCIKNNDNLDSMYNMLCTNKIENTFINIDEIINDVINDYYKSNRIEFNYKSNISDIMFNKAEFEIIISNLIDNSIKAIPERGYIDINVVSQTIENEKCKDCDSRMNGQYLIIEVKDNGIGISKNNEDYVFDPFFSTDEKSGLGLFIVQSIVNKHNGHITFDSKLGYGTKFTIYIPLDFEHEDIEQNNVIIAIEDDEKILKLYKKIVKDIMGYNFIGFTKVKDYIDYINENSPILSIIDLNVEYKFDGIDLLRMTNDRNIKTLVISGYIEKDETNHNIVINEATDYINKPFYIKEIIKVINNLI